MLTLLTEYPDRDRAAVLATINGFCAYDETTGASLERSGGRRQAGRTRRYFLSAPRLRKWLTAENDARAVDKANQILAKTSQS